VIRIGQGILAGEVDRTEQQVDVTHLSAFFRVMTKTPPSGCHHNCSTRERKHAYDARTDYHLRLLVIL
jgi:hypothetical protein